MSGQHKVMLACVAHGGWYPRGAARLIESIHEKSPGYEVTAWINCYPPGSPGSHIEGGYEYGAYISKPFAMRYMLDQGADIAILVDAAFFAIRSIGPLVEHITREGYYLCKNGNLVGEWASDRALDFMGLTRRAAFGVEEASSYCVGLNLTHERCRHLARNWAHTWRAIPGPHTADGRQGRNAGFVSRDPRVKGHRHDQCTLSLLAYEAGMHDLTERPVMTAYLGLEDARTVLVNRGLG
jgi:hypothetical protein